MAILDVEQADSLRLKLSGEGIVLVDYGAPWCPPCKVLLPLLEELDGEYGGEVTIAKVNCDHLPELASEASVMGLPTVIVYKDGQPMEKLVGLQPKVVYQGVLNKYSGAKANH
ncbi:thioredoxin family protein [Paenibacillus sp. NPDC058177]|uniref:thioredoxin family protein n=1 Tax=Paenibacillus sp. NPDC058177 TaxID=3346369 RepID=UPI0036DDCFF9